MKLRIWRDFLTADSFAVWAVDAHNPITGDYSEGCATFTTFAEAVAYVTSGEAHRNLIGA